MYNTFMQGKDLYCEIASKAFNKPYEDCQEFRPDGTVNKAGKERRSQAKTILLGVLYGRGVDSIAEQLGTSTKEAQQIKDSVFRGFPAIKQFEEDSILMSKTKYVPNLEHINRMASETVQMLIRSIEAYVEKDMEKAVDVIASDDVVDDLFDKNKAELIEQIQREPQSAESAADMLMVAKYFERIGDHATNIAEWVIFALDDKKMKK